MKKIAYFLILILCATNKIYPMQLALKHEMLKLWQDANREQDYPVTLTPIDVENKQARKLQKKWDNIIDQEEKQTKKEAKQYKRFLNIERNKKDHTKNYFLNYSPRSKKANL